MAKYLINYLDRRSTISKDIYGNFAEHIGRGIYEGLWVGKDSAIPNCNGVRLDVLNALKKIRLPLLRWPGGCFADTYHWKDAVGSQEGRKPIVNGVWGATVEDNSFGTHEFMDMCEEIGCDVYLNGNLGTGTVQEMVDWLEYITGDGSSEMAELRRKNGREKPWKVKYFGIGNEVWGGGGNMTADYYAGLYRQYWTFLKSKGFGQQNGIQFIASGPSSDDYEFTDKLVENLSRQTYPMRQVTQDPCTNGIGLHHYAFGGGHYFKLRTAEDFDEEEWYGLLSRGAETEELIERHDIIMSKYDPDGKIGLMVDEWGSWFKSEPGTNPAHLFQQNTVRDAVLAAVYLNIFNRHSARVRMCTLAQMINVLQALILTDHEKMILTPTYHVMDLFKGHMDAQLLGTFIENRKVGNGHYMIDQFYESASVGGDGVITATITNTSLDEQEEIELSLFGANILSAEAGMVSGEVHACNTFDMPENVTTLPLELALREGKLYFTMPPASVVALTIRAE